MKISLDGKWKFREVGSLEYLDGTVPGCVQLDLINLGRLPDPFYSSNEVLFYSLEEKDFEYVKEFYVENLDRYQVRKLVFEGIDTVADIYLNQYYLGRAENMFLKYEFDVSTALKEGKNTLKVILYSPIKEAERLKKVYQSKYDYPQRSWIRKAQYSYGWDWGPRILQMGIWRSIYLELHNGLEIVDEFIKTEHLSEDLAVVKVFARINSFEKPESGEIEISDGAEIKRLEPQVYKSKEGYFIEERIEIENPKLWFPNGYGEAHLYTFKIAVKTSNEVATKEVTTGLRTVRIIKEKDEYGESFIFEINGIKVFAKGANWIPADSILPRLTENDYKALINMAKDANMNMLRVWGGGIYEYDWFYNECDRNGIMVWQDFMFACSIYPDEFDFFVENFKKEAEYQIKRLRNHPCIVLWCGNNENNWGFRDWWNIGDPEFLGNRIYKKVLPQILLELDPTRPYHISSPYGGEHPNSEKAGDRHTWDIWSGWKDFIYYKHDNARFVSEFGFQAAAHIDTMKKYIPLKDQTIFSKVLRMHEKQDEGIERLIRYMAGWVGLPKDFDSFVYISQFVQKEAIKLAVEHYRKNKFRTAGALYWQLNDCWPVISWSSIDYLKRRKALYYESKRVFSKFLPAIEYENGRLKVKVVSDDITSRTGELLITIWDFDGRKHFERALKVNIPANDVTLAFDEKIENLNVLKGEYIYIPKQFEATMIGHRVDRGLLESIVFVSLIVDGREYENYFVFDKFINLELKPCQFEYEIKDDMLILRPRTPAVCLIIEADGDVENNFIFARPEKEYKIALNGANVTEVCDLLECLIR
ncbi:beta-mannosidase [Caldicellulosiruptor morganii]|uniref:Beta-mannosidase B n=1 Tax=Caldicellulosiruptor morganii TaxID=1387555 RepID=A0ABY7BQ95_9FIRM|nr:sugar-binding domain-containing protein [Caldicellulosiruptor morganii]WAM33945.1 glycoside hydrolase family 2 protein [Caldicellulosiruptor morganii]